VNGESGDSPTAVYLDVVEGRTRIGGDVGDYLELLRLFEAEVIAARGELAAAKPDELGPLLHRVKGAAANVAARALAQAALTGEEALATGQVVDVAGITEVMGHTLTAIAEESGTTRGAELEKRRERPVAQKEDGRHTVLIVEDVPSSAMAVAQALEEHYAIRLALDGESALGMAMTDDPPDLILVDVEMPGIDGFEVCRRLKADDRTRNLPVIFVTGRGSEDDEALGLSLGAIDFIHKPISPALLRARVRNHLLMKQQADWLRSASRTDPLTGLANRRFAVEQLEREWRRSLRSGDHFAVVMVDIDNFKLFNDTAGHLAGDDCLIAIAAAIAGTAREKIDVISRWGGEEFLLVLPDADLAGAGVVAQRMIDNVRALRWPHPDPDIEFVTVSAGGTAAIAQSDSSWNDMVSRADAALYRAKAAGRDRIEIID
jgi:diguanylate cyclase (GGDEF)-like protein